MEQVRAFPTAVKRLGGAACMDIHTYEAKPWAHQLQYLKMPLMSTSLTEASTMGIFTSGAPSPTRTSTPPERVAYRAKLADL